MLTSRDWCTLFTLYIVYRTISDYVLVYGPGRFLSLLTYLGMYNLSDHLSREFVLRLVEY